MRDLWRSNSFKLAAALVVLILAAVAYEITHPACKPSRVTLLGPDMVLAWCP